MQGEEIKKFKSTPRLNYLEVLIRITNTLFGTMVWHHANKYKYLWTVFNVCNILLSAHITERGQKTRNSKNVYKKLYLHHF